MPPGVVHSSRRAHGTRDANAGRATVDGKHEESVATVGSTRSASETDGAGDPAERMNGASRGPVGSEAAPHLIRRLVNDISDLFDKQIELAGPG